jgi:hypothetical protein
MRAVRLGCIQLATRRRKGGSDRDVRRPYEVQTVEALVSLLRRLLPAQRRRLGGSGDGRRRARKWATAAFGNDLTLGSLSSALRRLLHLRNVISTDPSMMCRVDEC